ncbi:hypothetical protein BKA69DRAFT_1173422 [Paraphysoderma sedebokerense]|nr:hypothetical protein BKA69DRAFT_1173422 [Paraphysoderma sedebokerense]
MAANRSKGYSPTHKRRSLGYDHWSPDRSKSSKKSDKFRSPRRVNARSKSQQSPPRELSHSKNSACQKDDGSRKVRNSRSDIESLLVWRPPPNDRTTECLISESKLLNFGKAVEDDSALTPVVLQSLCGLNSVPDSLARTGQSVPNRPPVSSATQPFHSHSNYPPIGQHHEACFTTPQMADVPLQLPLMFQSIPSDLLAHFLQVMPPTSVLPSLPNTSTLSSLNLHDGIRGPEASITSSGVGSSPSPPVTDGFSPTVSHPSHETDKIQTSPVSIPDVVSLTQIYETDLAERLADRQFRLTRSNTNVVNTSCMSTSTTDSAPLTAPSRQCSLPNSTASFTLQSQPNDPTSVTDNHAQTSFPAPSDLPIVQSRGAYSHLTTSVQGTSRSENICNSDIDFKAPSLSSAYVPLTKPYQVDCSKKNANLEVTAQDEGTYSSSMIRREEESRRRRPNSQTKQKRKRSRRRHSHSEKEKNSNDGKRSKNDGCSSVNSEDQKAVIQCNSSLDGYVDEINEGISVQLAHSIQSNQTTNNDASMKQGCSGAKDFQIDGSIPGLLTAALVGVSERYSEENLKSSTSNEESPHSIEKANSKENERKESEATSELSVTNCTLPFNTPTSISNADIQPCDDINISASTMTPNSPSLFASHRLPHLTGGANEPEVTGATADRSNIEADQALLRAVEKKLEVEHAESTDIVARVPSSSSKVVADTALDNVNDEFDVKRPTVMHVNEVDPQQMAIDNLLLLASVSDNQTRQFGPENPNSDYGSSEPDQFEVMEYPKQQLLHLEKGEEFLHEQDKRGEKITQTILQDHLSGEDAKTGKGSIQSAFQIEHKCSNIDDNSTDVEETDEEDVESDLETDKIFNESMNHSIGNGTNRIEYLQSDITELDVAESKCRDPEDSERSIVESEDEKENMPCWNPCTWDWNWGAIGEKKMRFYTIEEDEVDLDWDHRLDIEFQKEDAQQISQPVAKKTSKILDIIGIRPKSTRIRNLAGTEGNSNPIEQKQSQSTLLSRQNRDKPTLSSRSKPSTLPIDNDCKSNPKPKSNQTSKDFAKVGDVASSSSSSDAEFLPNKSTGRKGKNKTKKSDDRKRRLRAPRKQKQQAKDQLQAKVDGSQSNLKTNRNGRARSAAVKASAKIKGTAQPSRKRKGVASN